MLDMCFGTAVVLGVEGSTEQPVSFPTCSTTGNQACIDDYVAFVQMDKGSWQESGNKPEAERIFLEKGGWSGPPVGLILPVYHDLAGQCVVVVVVVVRRYSAINAAGDRGGDEDCR